MPAPIRLALTAVIVIVAALATNFALKRLSLTDVVSQLGFSWLLVATKVDAFLGRVRLPSFSGRPQTPSPTDYVLPWYEMVVLGALFIAGVGEAGGGLAGLIAAAMGTAQESLRPLIILSGLYTLSLTVFLIGRWIGLRAGSYAILSLIGAAVLGRLLLSGIDYSMTTSSQFAELTGQEKGVGNLLTGAVGVLVFVAIFGLIGLRLGRRAKVAHQIEFLIRKLGRADKERVLAGIAQQTDPRPVQTTPVLTPAP